MKPDEATAFSDNTNLCKRCESHETYRRNVLTYMAANYLDVSDIALQARSYMGRSVQGVNVFQALDIALEASHLTPAKKLDHFVYHPHDKIFDTLEKNSYLFEKLAFGTMLAGRWSLISFLVWVMRTRIVIGSRSVHVWISWKVLLLLLVVVRSRGSWYG